MTSNMIFLASNRGFSLIRIISLATIFLFLTLALCSAATDNNRKTQSNHNAGVNRSPNNNNNNPHNNNNNSKKCPNCRQSADDAQRQATDELRIEVIKQQILSKLGLKQKPNITSSIPREVVLDTLWRADEGMDLLNPRIQGNRPKSDNGDDYYARTSEIITFAEPGKNFTGFFFLFFVLVLNRDFKIHYYIISNSRCY